VLSDSGAAWCCGRVSRYRRARRGRWRIWRRRPGRIFYTSGTTGFPKGAMTTQENFLSNVETALRVLGLDRATGRRQRGLISVPLFQSPAATAAAGAPVVGWVHRVAAHLQRAEFLRAIVDERISCSPRCRRSTRWPSRSRTSPTSTSAGLPGSPTVARRSPPTWSAGISGAFRTRAGQRFRAHRDRVHRHVPADAWAPSTRLGGLRRAGGGPRG